MASDHCSLSVVGQRSKKLIVVLYSTLYIDFWLALMKWVMSVSYSTHVVLCCIISRCSWHERNSWWWAVGRGASKRIHVRFNKTYMDGPPVSWSFKFSASLIFWGQALRLGEYLHIISESSNKSKIKVSYCTVACSVEEANDAKQCSYSQCYRRQSWVFVYKCIWGVWSPQLKTIWEDLVRVTSSPAVLFLLLHCVINMAG